MIWLSITSVGLFLTPLSAYADMVGPPTPLPDDALDSLVYSKQMSIAFTPEAIMIIVAMMIVIIALSIAIRKK